MANKTTAGIARVESKELLDAEVSFEGWEDITADPNRLEWLLLVTKYYSDLFDTIWYDCRQLTDYDQTIYLIDFDVLRTYLEGGAAQRLDSFVVGSLFHNSTRRYALPAGAFLELLDYISDLLKRASDLDHSLTSDMAPSDVILRLGDALSIKGSHNLEVDEVLEELHKHLDKRTQSLTRLLNVLTDPRFDGVVTEYDQQDAAWLGGIISQLPRNHKGPRSKVDNRDAVNLAIAFNHARRAREKRKVAHLPTAAYILISNTRMMYRLPHWIADHMDHPEVDESDVLTQLSRMLGVESLPDPNIIGGFYPVMHPRRIINAELLGVYDSPGRILSRAKTLRDNFRKVADLLEHKAIEQKTFGDSALPMRELGKVQAGEQKIVEDIFMNLASAMLSSKSGGLYMLEQHRVAEISTNYVRRLQGGGSISLKDELKQKSTGLTRLLGDISVALGGTRGFDYEVKVKPTYRSPFDEVEITQLPEEESHEPVICGERYLTQREDTDVQYSHYVLRWPVAKTPREFAEAMGKIIIPILPHKDAGQWSDRSLPLRAVSENESLWDEGLVVYAGDNAFGCELAAVLDNWEALELKNVSTILETINLGDEEWPFNNVIQQYRINTRFGDFIFDLEPVEGENSRYLTVISHLNIGDQITLLYQQTGQFFIITSKFSSSLERLLTDFSALPDTHKQRET